jgi:hypothetical protein
MEEVQWWWSTFITWIPWSWFPKFILRLQIQHEENTSANSNHLATVDLKYWGRKLVLESEAGREKGMVMGRNWLLLDPEIILPLHALCIHRQSCTGLKYVDWLFGARFAVGIQWPGRGGGDFCLVNYLLYQLFLRAHSFRRTKYWQLISQTPATSRPQ